MSKERKATSKEKRDPRNYQRPGMRCVAGSQGQAETASASPRPLNGPAAALLGEAHNAELIGWAVIRAPMFLGQPCGASRQTSDSIEDDLQSGLGQLQEGARISLPGSMTFDVGMGGWVSRV
jgi:hypothetical protein